MSHLFGLCILVAAAFTTTVVYASDPKAPDAKTMNVKAIGAQRARASDDLSAGSIQRGRATWYGAHHHGLRTASGETFDMRALTAAHRSLPFGTRLRVTNLDNGKSVQVRVNDRGPHVRGRMLDLSYAAARAIGGVGAGIMRVRMDVVALPAMTAQR